MDKNYLDALPDEEKTKLGYIEGREDLWETKILDIKSEGGEDQNNILVATRDPGSANALLPVLKELSKDARTHLTALTDGRAEDIIKKNFRVEDISPEGHAMEFDKVIPPPQVILMDLSSGEMGIDTYVGDHFKDTPKVLVEDYYSTAHKLIRTLIERELPLPEKICVMDQGAKDLILQDFPELEERIEITGQPAFDRIAKEDTEIIASDVRKRLKIKPTDKLVSYMSTMDEPQKISEMAKALQESGAKFYFVFRRHPRDNVEYGTYRKILTDAGVEVIDTDGFTSDEIGAAADVVLTTWSTSGLEGIYRRKPTVHIVDPNFRVESGLSLPLVPVKLGASIGLNSMNGLKEILPQLLDTQSDLSRKLQEGMGKNYPADGKNAERVANVVRQYNNKK